jgi:hypothetical protein
VRTHLRDGGDRLVVVRQRSNFGWSFSHLRKSGFATLGARYGG